MTCNDMINNITLVSTLGRVKQRIHGIGASKRGRTLPKGTVCVGNIGYDTVLLHVF